MATVYSYVRFSSDKQEQGDSVRRQVAAGAAWMARHPEHTLDTTLRLRDLGVSAFKGRNLDKDKGDLGKFIQLARDGRVAKGSILMLENLDRFSRQPTSKAYRIFTDLVEAGVKVLTLDPEQLIDDSNDSKMEVVLPVIIKMQLSYEESRKKSGRIADEWEQRRQRAAKDGTPMTRRCPVWLQWNEKANDWAVKAGAKEVITYIYTRACEGVGQCRLTAELQKRFKPLGKSKRWNGSMVASILTSKTVIGEMTPTRNGGEPLPSIPGYYPRIIPDSLFYRARAACVSRKKARGRNLLFVNLFVGLVKFGDGFGGHIQTATRKNGKGRTTQRRLVSAGHRDRVKGACPLSIDYCKVERYLLAALWQLRADDLLTQQQTDKDGLRSLREELEGVEARLAELESALTGSKQPVEALVKAISAQTAKRDMLRQQLEKAQQTKATARAKPIKAVHDLLKAIESAPEGDRHGLRLKLRQQVAAVVERVDVEPYRADDGKAGGEPWRHGSRYAGQAGQCSSPLNLIRAWSVLTSWQRQCGGA